MHMKSQVRNSVQGDGTDHSTVTVPVGQLKQVGISDVFHLARFLWGLQPGRRPAGFDAGSFLQGVIVGCQFRVTIFR